MVHFKSNLLHKIDLKRPLMQSKKHKLSNGKKSQFRNEITGWENSGSQTDSSMSGYLKKEIDHK